jgi:hypothetical protein
VKATVFRKKNGKRNSLVEEIPKFVEQSDHMLRDMKSSPGIKFLICNMGVVWCIYIKISMRLAATMFRVELC